MSFHGKADKYVRNFSICGLFGPFFVAGVVIEKLHKKANRST